MKSKNIIALLLAGLFVGAGTAVYAADQDQDQLKTQDRLQVDVPDQDRDRDKDRIRDRDTIYGSQLMSTQEINQYRARINNMKTEPEREAYKNQHRKRMEDRARERNTELPGGAAGRSRDSGAGAGTGGQRGR